MIYVASGSRLPLLAACAASCALPRFASDSEAAALGNALHEHMADRVGLGISGAVDRLDETAKRWGLNERMTAIFRGRAIGFDWTPPRGAIPEIALGLFDDGHVEQISGGRGWYPRLPGLILPAQLDVMWAEPTPLYRDSTGAVRCPPESVLNVIDFKSGDEKYCPPVEVNFQTLGQAVLAALWTGATAVLPSICFIRKGPGIFDTPASPLDTDGIVTALLGLRELLARGEAQRAAYAAGEPLAYRTGPQCLYCDASPGCPAKMGEVRQLVLDPSPLAVGSMLTDEQAARLAVLHPILEQMAKKAKEALVAHTQATGAPIAMSAGRGWGSYLEPEDTIDIDKLLPVLEEELGAELAQAAVARKLTKEGIKNAIRAAHEADGIKRQQGSAFKRVLARGYEAGGIVKVAKRKFGVHAIADTPQGRQMAAYDLEDIEIDGDPEA